MFIITVLQQGCFKVCNVILDERKINQTWEHHIYLDLQHKTINIRNKDFIFIYWNSYLIIIYWNCIWYLLNQTEISKLTLNACSNIKLCLVNNLFWSKIENAALTLLIQKY